MKIPNRTQCFQIIRKMGMMDHIVDHSIMVGNVTLCLCSHVRQTSPSLNVELATAAALLHDITKTRSFETGERHSDTGGDLLVTLGYPEVGNIIRQHVILDNCEKTHRSRNRKSSITRTNVCSMPLLSPFPDVWNIFRTPTAAIIICKTGSPECGR